MALARSAPTSAASVSLRELEIWGLVVVGAAYWSNVVRTARAADMGGAGFVLEAVLQNGAFCVAAWALIAVRTRQAPPGRQARAGEVAIMIGVCLICGVAARQAAIVALAALAVQFLRDGGSGRMTAALLLALALDMAWSSACTMPLHTVAADLDAQAVRALLRAVGVAAEARDNVVANADGSGVEILVRCASSYPLAAVWLAYLAVSVHQGRLPQWSDAPWVVASLAASVALTESRLTWMAARETDFVWLHEGGGATLYGLVATGSAVLFPLLAAHASRAERPA
jgi:hypothetical protein